MHDSDEPGAVTQCTKDVGVQTVEVLDLLCKKGIQAGNGLDHLDDGLAQGLLGIGKLTARHEDKGLAWFFVQAAPRGKESLGELLMTKCGTGRVGESFQ